MKKTLIGPILTVIGLLFFVGIFIYFYVSINRIEKRAMDLQTAIITDSGKVTAIVNFLNSKSNVQTNKK